MAKYGNVVSCTVHDDKYKSIIESSHRDQIAHQVAIMGIDKAVYVQGISGDSILCELKMSRFILVLYSFLFHFIYSILCAVVVVSGFLEENNSHLESLSDFMHPMIAWIHSPSLLNNGFLTQDDIPEQASLFYTIQENNFREMTISRFQLWSAFAKLLLEKQLIHPVYIFKHGIQYKYNKRKGGLDMFTEF